MDVRKNYYATLGVPPSIDDTALTAVCRALLKKYHPDVAAGATSDARAAEIIEAYRVLGDTERRKAYDAARRAFVRERGERDQPEPEKPLRQPGIVRTVLTAFALSFGLRALISVGVAGFVAMGPLGSMLSGAIKPLAALGLPAAPDATADTRFHIPFFGSGTPARNVVKHVESAGADRHAPATAPHEEPTPHGAPARAPSPASVRIANGDATVARSAAGELGLFDTLYGPRAPRHVRGGE